MQEKLLLECRALKGWRRGAGPTALLMGTPLTAKYMRPTGRRSEMVNVARECHVANASGLHQQLFVRADWVTTVPKGLDAHVTADHMDTKGNYGHVNKI